MVVSVYISFLLVVSVGLATAYPYVSEMPTVENTDFGTLVATVSFGKDNPILGTGIPKYYILQYRKEGYPWKNFSTIEMPDTGDIQTGYIRNFTITGLESGVVYNVRVLLADNNMRSYSGDLVPYYIVPTMCYLPEEYDYQVVPALNSGSLSFSWTYKNKDERWCPILDYQVSWMENDRWIIEETTQSQFEIPGFETDKTIKFRVRTVTTGGYAPYSKNITYPAAPEVYPYVSQMPTAENTDYGTIVVTVYFGRDNPILGTVTPKYYIVQYREEEEPWEDFTTIEMPDKEHIQTEYIQKFTITGLKSGVVYNVRVLLADNNMRSYSGDLVPYYIVPTMCYLPEEYDYQVTPVHTDDSLSFTWTYKNANERWCPLLYYQVWWMDTDHWITQETTQMKFEIPGFQPEKTIKFRVRAVTTGSYAPYSKNITYPTVTDVFNTIEDLEAAKITATSVVLQWKYNSNGKEVPTTFFINVREVKLETEEDCCQTFPTLEVPLQEELHYEIELEGLKPVAKYSVSVAASTSQPETSQTINFMTPPPPLPVDSLPNVKVNTNDVWSWLPQEVTNSLKDSHIYKPYIKHYLLLVLPENNAWADDSGIVHKKIHELLKDVIKKPFFVASHYKEDDEIILEDGRTGEFELGRFNNMDLPAGTTHRLAAAQVKQYGDIYSVDIVYSTPFKAAN